MHLRFPVRRGAHLGNYFFLGHEFGDQNLIPRSTIFRRDSDAKVASVLRLADQCR
jgi:hypothetical protein